MKIILFISIILPLFLRAQSAGPERLQMSVASEFNPNDLIIDQIECVGNETTSCDLIQKEVYLNPGDKINEEELANAKIRLKVKNLFSSVNISLKKGSERGHVNVVIEVQEANPLYTEFEFGATHVYGEAGEDTGYGLSAGFGHRNLFGSGKVLQATVNVRDINTDISSYSFNLNYFDPHVFGAKKIFFGLVVDHSYFSHFEDTLYRNIQSSGSAGIYSVLRDQTSIRTTLGYRVFDFTYLSISSNKFLSTYSTLDGYADGIQKMSSLESESHSIDYGWNSEDDTYFATEGSRFNFGFTKYPTQKYYSQYYSINFQKNWNWNSRHVFTLGSYNGSSNFSDQEFGRIGTLFKYGYQFDSQTADIVRGRWYFGVNPNYISLGGADLSWDTGVLLEHKKYGILKLSFTNWSVR